MDLFLYRENIAKNLSMFIRLKGYSKSSFAKLTGISRPTLDQFLAGESPNSTFNRHLKQIISALELPIDYFLIEPSVPPERWRTPMIQYSDRAPEERKSIAKDLLNELDILMSMAPIYLTEDRT